MTQTLPKEQPQTAADDGRPRRWRKYALVLSVLCAIGIVFHGTLLHGLASLLVVEDPTVTADAVVLSGTIDGESGFELAANLYREGAIDEVLLLEGRQSRLVKLGILPEFHSLASDNLRERGVSSEACTMLRYESDSKWGMMRQLGNWLEDHPETEALLVVPRFSSRQLASVANSTLTAAQRKRIHFRSLPHRRYDETNWWRSRQGVMGFCTSSVILAHVWLCGEPAERLAEWNPDNYAASLTKGRGE